MGIEIISIYLVMTIVAGTFYYLIKKTIIDDKMPKESDS